jgi:hypothetical protein
VEPPVSARPRHPRLRGGHGRGAATGLFLYLRLGAGLDTTIEQSLRSRAGDVTAPIEQADSGLEESARSTLTEQGESFAQIIEPSGDVVDATPAVRGRALLKGEQLPDEVGETVIVDREAIPGEDDPVRVLARPVRAQDRRLIVIVGAALEDREEALRNLGSLLVIGGPVALVLASVAGYAAVAAALHPVDRMRRRAAAIQTADPRVRLPKVAGSNPAPAIRKPASRQAGFVLPKPVRAPRRGLNMVSIASGTVEHAEDADAHVRRPAPRGS